MVSFSTQFGRDPVRPANDKSQILAPGVAPFGKAFCKFGAGRNLSLFIHAADHGPFGDRFAQQLGLGLLAALLGLDLDDLGWSKAQGAAGAVKTGQIVVDQGLFRACTQAADGADMYLHQRAGASVSAPPGSHIFSSW